jgi:hypothetical protein
LSSFLQLFPSPHECRPRILWRRGNFREIDFCHQNSTSRYSAIPAIVGYTRPALPDGIRGANGRLQEKTRTGYALAVFSAQDPPGLNLPRRIGAKVDKTQDPPESKASPTLRAQTKPGQPEPLPAHQCPTIMAACDANRSRLPIHIEHHDPPT